MEDNITRPTKVTMVDQGLPTLSPPCFAPHTLRPSLRSILCSPTLCVSHFASHTLRRGAGAAGAAAPLHAQKCPLKNDKIIEKNLKTAKS